MRHRRVLWSPVVILALGVLTVGSVMVVAGGSDDEPVEVEAGAEPTSVSTSASTTTSSLPFDPSAPFGNVDQELLEECLARGEGARCAEQVPNLEECMHAGIRCRELGDPTEGYLAAPDPNQAPVTREQVLERAGKLIALEGAEVERVRAIETLNALIYVVTDGRMSGEVPLPGDRPVWMLVAEGEIPFHDEGLMRRPGDEPPPKTVGSYVIVFDALTGYALHECWGCLSSEQAAEAERIAAELAAPENAENVRRAAVEEWERLGFGHGAEQAGG